MKLTTVELCTCGSQYVWYSDKSCVRCGKDRKKAKLLYKQQEVIKTCALPIVLEEQLAG